MNLIASTTRTKGLKVKCEIDKNEYETGKKITDFQLKRIEISRDEFHGEWNYIIKPSLKLNG